MICHQRIVFILVIFAAYFVSSSFSISCYTCDSLFNKACLDPFEPEIVEKGECSDPIFHPNQNATACKKRISFGKWTSRECYYGDVNKAKQKCSSSEECEFCTTDLCNGSSVIGPIAVVTAVFAVIAHSFF